MISSEGHEFIVDRKCAMVSGTIRSMLDGGGFLESEAGEISFKEINTNILEKVIQYFYYKVKYTNSTGQTPDFPIEPEIALELLMAANFLDT
uniref:Elongin-C n=1 Tax=Arcella intermedia TaxID=1963864 RepID=A0A6B2LUV1_9EUKA